jgi:hypothetical protein
MRKSKKVKFIVHCPIDSEEEIRQAIGEAGGGSIGDYTFCSFTVTGVGRSKGNGDTQPVYGKPEELSGSEEEKIEVTVPRKIKKDVVNAVLKVNPYEEPTYDIYTLEEL